MTTKIQKWGNSLAVRIPFAMAKELSFQEGSIVQFSTDGRALILEPKKQKEYTLKELLKGITKDNTPDRKDIEWFTNMKPVGKEIGIW